MAPGSTWHMPISCLALSSVFIVPPNIPAQALGSRRSSVLSPGTVDGSGQKVRLAMEQLFSLRFSRVTINDTKGAMPRLDVNLYGARQVKRLGRTKLYDL